MNLLLLCTTSVFLARYLEKKMRVASIAHAVLFIVMSFLFLFHSDIALVDEAMINIFGQENFDIVHESLVATARIYRGSISSLFIIELFVYVSLCVSAVGAAIKGFRKFFKSFNYKLVFDFKELADSSRVSFTERMSNSQNTYLVLEHLRN